MRTELQNYQDQFGNINFKKGEDARSVYSPAAYLADLLQLLDDYFGDTKIHSRRPDLKSIPLDADHTFTLLPYIDIVNKQLLKKIPNLTYDKLRTFIYPLNLPFNLHDERVKQYLSYFEVERSDIHSLFNAQDTSQQARWLLGLSPEMLDTITSDGIDGGNESDNQKNRTTLRKLLKLQDNEDLSNISVFMDKTGIDAEALLQLLHPSLNFQDIEVSSVFTTASLNGHAAVDELETKITWHPATEPGETREGTSHIPITWFLRAFRIIRLSQQTGISIADLYLILRSCCNNILDKAAVQTIAIIKKIADDYELDIDIASSFFSPMETEWQDNTIPDDLFNRIFNQNFSELDKQYISVMASIPEAYKKYIPLTTIGRPVYQQKCHNQKTYHACPAYDFPGFTVNYQSV